MRRELREALAARTSELSEALQEQRAAAEILRVMPNLPQQCAACFRCYFGALCACARPNLPLPTGWKARWCIWWVTAIFRSAGACRWSGCGRGHRSTSGRAAHRTPPASAGRSQGSPQEVSAARGSCWRRIVGSLISRHSRPLRQFLIVRHQTKRGSAPMRAAANCACRWQALVTLYFDGAAVTLVTPGSAGSDALSQLCLGRLAMRFLAR